MVRPTIPLFWGQFPWLEPQDSLTNPEVALNRGFVVLPHDCGTEVYCEETKDPLPLVTKWIDSRGDRWSKFELPRGESSASHTRIHFHDGGGNDGQVAMDVPLGSGIARSFLDETLDNEDVVPASLLHYSRIRNHIDQHIQFMNDLNDQVRSNRFYWEGNCGGLAIRSVHRATRRWLNSDDKDNARLALIVKLARDISRILGQVCENPRVVLRRSREFQNISRIQEIDSTCLRWIARQPGRDIYERAGSRQQLLGVVRKEDTDTLENRVIKDLLHRARVECSNYLSIYREFQSHDRVRTVASFRRQIIDWERSTEMNGVKPLIGPVQPNYVLLHEPKYLKLWESYQALLSQQKQKDDIWKWRDRTFCESCQFAVLSVLSELARKSNFSKSDIVLQQEAISGKFVSTKTEFGSIPFQGSKNRQMLVFCHGYWATKCPYIDRGFYPLAADFFLVQLGVGSCPTIIPFWCFAEAAVEGFRDGLRQLESKLASLPNAAAVHPIVLTFERSVEEQSFFGNRGRVIGIENPAQEYMSTLGSSLLEILGNA